MFESGAPSGAGSPAEAPAAGSLVTSAADGSLAGLRSGLAGLPGGAVATALQHGADRLADVDEDLLVELAAAAHRVTSWAGFVQLQVMAELLARRSQLPPDLAARPGAGELRELAEDLARRSTVAEVALATGTSEYAAGMRLNAATALERRLPRTRGAFRAGAVDWPKVAAIVDATSGLTDAVAQAVDAEVLARLSDSAAGLGTATMTVPALRKLLAEAVARHHPQAADNARRAVDQRRVVFTPAADGMTELWALLPALPAAQAQAVLRELAEAAAGPDDGRTADQRRADTLLDLLIGRAWLADPEPLADSSADRARTAEAAERPDQPSEPDQHPDRPAGARRATMGQACSQVRPQILVTVGLSTLLGLSQDPGHLAGYGPLPAEMIREVAASGTWRCAIVDDRQGTLLGLGRSTYTPDYRPGRPLQRHLTVRDQTCTFPGCRQPAHRCDHDHRTRFPTGPTCECNVSPLCRHHHRLKHRAGFTPTTSTDPGHPPGTVTWTTPAGRRYHRAPTPLTTASPLTEPALRTHQATGTGTATDAATDAGTATDAAPPF